MKNNKKHNKVRGEKLTSWLRIGLTKAVAPHLDRLQSRDVPDIHPVPGKCQISHYSVLSGHGKIMGPSNES